MIRLYYSPGAASLAPHFVLKELGLQHELVLVDRTKGEQFSPRYTRLNPNARVPTIQHRDLVLYESGAICLYLADLAPGRFAPAEGARNRPLLYQWLFFLSNTVQPALMSFHYPEAQVTGAECCVEAARRRAETWTMELFARIDAQLEDREYLLGSSPTVCDSVLLMLCRWGRALPHPPRNLKRLGALLSRLLERDAVIEALAHERISAPYV